MKVNAELGEGLIENSFGDRAIIPKDKWGEVKKMIDEGCYDCVDKFVAGLPKLQDKAQQGSVYPDEPKQVTNDQISLSDSVGTIGNTFTTDTPEDEKQRRYQDWLSKMQPPTTNVPYSEQIVENLKSLGEMAKPALTAIGTAASETQTKE